jgi:hypothetical protein
MTLVDQFESVFRSADRRRYRYDRPEIGKVVVVHDLEDVDAATRFLEATRRFLAEVDDATFVVFGPDDYDDADGLRVAVEAEEPGLVVSYRNVKYGTWRFPTPSASTSTCSRGRRTCRCSSSPTPTSTRS